MRTEGSLVRRQNKQFEIDFFNRVSAGGHYETNSDQFYDYLFRTLDLARFDLNGTLLECGCGTGSFGKRMLKRFSAIQQIIGVDIAEGMIEESSKDSSKHYQAICGDLEDRSLFTKGQFDTVLCPFILHHFPSLEHILSNLTIWLKDGGQLILCEPNGSAPMSILFKAGRKVCELILGKDWVLRNALATPNEKDHSVAAYVQALRSLGFVIEVKKTITFKHKNHPIWTLSGLISSTKQVLGFFCDKILHGTDFAGATIFILARRSAKNEQVAPYEQKYAS